VADPTPLELNWKKPLGEVVNLPPDPGLTAEWAERHRLYSTLVLALVSTYWNGNKRGDRGLYPWREGQRDNRFATAANPDGFQSQLYVGGNYQGHNIACIAVDGEGDIIDFDFNHNELFNSSVEHAESRLIRRVFSLAQLSDGWQLKTPGASARKAYGTLLNNVTVYTSLESCAQCAGIMTLGRVERVVYLQSDPGQFMVGNLLYKLGDGAPRPLSGADIGLSHFDSLNNAYMRFQERVGKTPFFHQDRSSMPDKSASVTSFLCTDLAKAVFDTGLKEMLTLDTCKYPDFRPAGVANAKSNQEIIGHCRDFLAYAGQAGRRGTPHKL